MNTFYRIVLTVAMLLFYSTSWADPASATCEPPCVDPCQFGCPKSGCPNCPEGGPIGAKAEQDKAGGDHHVGNVKVKQKRHQEKQKVKQTQQGTSNPLRTVASMSCAACEAKRSSCFANCNASGPAVPGGQVECVKQCYRTFPCVPNRDCE